MNNKQNFLDHTCIHTHALGLNAHTDDFLRMLRFMLFARVSITERGAATGWFLTACAHEFLFCGYAGKLLVPITAFLLLLPRNLNVEDSIIFKVFR